jgi:hypothetical protein
VNRRQQVAVKNSLSHHPSVLKEQVMRRTRVCRALAGVVTGILILASGCADAGPTGVELRSTAEISSSRHPLVGTRAEPLAYATPGRPATYSSIIGPAGGTLDFEIGSITFPAGALSRPTRITAAIDGVSVGATFGPHGTVFPVGREPELRFRFAGLEIESVSLQIQYLSGVLIDEVLPTTIDLVGRTASAKIFHFSPYILGAGRSAIAF